MSNLVDIESRLSLVEQTISKDYSPECNIQLLPTLTKANETLNKLSTKRDRFKIAFRKIPEITKYLDPQFVSSEEVDISAKKEYVLLAEEKIRSTAEMLNKINQLKTVLDSSAIAGFFDHDTKLKKVNLHLLEQLNETETLDADIKQLLTKYNNLVQTLSEHFAHLDQVLVGLEKQNHES